MLWENPGAYDEARKRIRENSEREHIVIEEKKEHFEKSREKVHSRKKLDVFELKRRIETGQSLELLKWDIREALDRGDISVDAYREALHRLDDKKLEPISTKTILPEYTIDPRDFPLSDLPITKYFESQKLGDSPLLDIGGFVYGGVQGSVFLLYLCGRIILDTLLLPRDLYILATKK
jgi:hypothetical protein